MSMPRRLQVKRLGRRCLIVLAAAASLAVSLVGSGTAQAAATAAKRSPQGDRSTDSFICSLARYVEPFDNLDVLGAVDKYLEDNEVDWLALGAFGLVTGIKQVTCPGAKAATGLQHIRPLFPSLSDLTLQAATPGYVVAPSTALNSFFVEAPLDEVVSADIKVSFLWVSGKIMGEPLLMSAVDLRQDPFGGIPRQLQQGTNAGLYYVNKIADLTVGEWYQEALRADDINGVSPWACSEPFRVYYNELLRSYYWEVGRQSATELADSCLPDTVVTPSSWWYTPL